MKRKGVDIIHLDSCLVVGYLPCPRLESFINFIPAKYGVEVIIGIHPILQLEPAVRFLPSTLHFD